MMLKVSIVITVKLSQKEDLNKFLCSGNPRLEKFSVSNPFHSSQENQ